MSELRCIFNIFWKTHYNQKKWPPRFQGSHLTNIETTLLYNHFLHHGLTASGDPYKVNPRV